MAQSAAQDIVGGDGGNAIKKVGVGASSNSSWVNFQIPFVQHLADGASLWSFTGLSSVTYTTADLGGTGSFFTTLHSSFGISISPDEIIFEGRVTSGAGLGTIMGFGLCGGSNPYATAQGTNALSVGFVRDTANQWYIRSADGSAFTETPIATLTGVSKNCRIEYTPATSVNYYVDDVLVGTINTNVPSAGTLVGFGGSRINTAVLPSFAIKLV